MNADTSKSSSEETTSSAKTTTTIATGTVNTETVIERSLNCPLGHEFHIYEYFDNNYHNEDTNDNNNIEEEEGGGGEGVTTTTTTTVTAYPTKIIPCCCFLCKKDISENGSSDESFFYGCPSLDVKICFRCIPSFKHNCDLCNTTINKQSFRGCRQCDIDICELCIGSTCTQDVINTLPSQYPEYCAKPHSEEKDIILQYHWWQRIVVAGRRATLKRRNGWMDLVNAPYCIRNNIKIVMEAVKRSEGRALKYASPELRNNKHLVIVAVQNNGTTLKFASPNLRDDIDVVLAAVKCSAIKTYSGGGGDDDDDDDGCCPLQFASPNLRNNRHVVIEAVTTEGYALKFASPELQNDKQIAKTAIKNNNYVTNCFQFASPNLRCSIDNKEFVLRAIQQNVDNIKYITCDELKRDPDVLIAAGMVDKHGRHNDDIDIGDDDDNDDGDKDTAIDRQQQQQQQQQHGLLLKTAAAAAADVIATKIAFSTRFALDPTSYSEATNFTSLFKLSKYIHQAGFKIYAPNAFDKKTCDPEWTNFDHPCRGTIDTCTYNNILTTTKTIKDGRGGDGGRRPTNGCCWRYSFRFQLQEAKSTGGFMIQLVETGIRDGKVQDATLGNGQRIELDMANSMGVKVFQVYRPPGYGGRELSFYKSEHVEAVTSEICRWYNDDDEDLSVTVIRHNG